MLLGLVLGPLSENRLFLSTDNYGLAWTHRPGVIGIFILTLFGIFYPMYKNRREEREKALEQGSAKAMAEAAQPAACNLAPARYSLVALILIWPWHSGRAATSATAPDYFPGSSAYRRLFSCFLQLARDLHGTIKRRRLHPGENAEVEIAPAVVRKRTLDVIGWTVGFFVAIWLLGFSIAVPLMILLYLKSPAKRAG